MAQQFHETRFRVRYAETDQMGIVYYANYLVWMEIGRAEYFRALGGSYRVMEAEDGILLAVADAYCRFLSPARYDEEVMVRTHIAQSNARLVRFDYEMEEAASARKLATGYTKHIFCGRDMRPVRLPERYHALFGLSTRAGAGESGPSEIGQEVHPDSRP